MARMRSAATRQAQQDAAAAHAAEVHREAQRAERRRRGVVGGGVVLVALVLLLGIGYAVQSGRDTTGQVTQAPRGAVDDHALARGPADAPVTVTVYEDFMCPFCGQFEAASAGMLTDRAEEGEVRVEYRVVSFLDDYSEGTEYSTRATSALGVVLEEAGGAAALRFHDLLFEHQPEEGTEGLADAELVDLAVRAGADPAAVRGPIEDRRFEPWVVDASEAASRADVTSTPTVLVDGDPVGGAGIEELVANLDRRVARRLPD